MILVDVGVWLAALWGRHVHHRVAARWIDRQSDDLLLCRVTQLGLLRLTSNRAVMGAEVLTRDRAWRLIDQLRSDSRIVWAEEPAELELAFRTLSSRRDHSHKVWTDDYLAAFALASGAALATLDSQLPHRYPSVRVELVA